MMKIADILAEVKQNFKIYCDLDGVLVDFRKGYKKLTGKEPPPADSEADKKAFWKPIDDYGAGFWADLEWTKDGKELWRYIKKFKPEILSSPSNSQTSVKGKKMWMSKNLPGVKLNLEQSRNKQKYAKTNYILIDDREDICERWENKGGIAIRHKGAASTISALKKLKIKVSLQESEIDIENEIFSAYNGRYLFDVSKAYDLIRSGEVKSIVKMYKPDMMHFLSHPEFSATSPEKVQSLEMDYEKPIGLIANFKNPETDKTEYILVDGNHRTRKAVEDDHDANFYVVQDPEDVNKFMKVDTSKAHRLFPQDDED